MTWWLLVAGLMAAVGLTGLLLWVGYLAFFGLRELFKAIDEE